MKFPPDVQFHEDARLLIYRPRGLLNEAMVNKILRIVGELESSLKEPFNRFLDSMDADQVELNFRYVIHVSLYRRLSYAGRQQVKSAILATQEAMIHYGKLHAIITQGSLIKVRIFQDREEAAKWLGAPVDLLLP
jgi:hypothetical protein